MMKNMSNNINKTSMMILILLVLLLVSGCDDSQDNGNVLQDITDQQEASESTNQDTDIVDTNENQELDQIQDSEENGVINSSQISEGYYKDTYELSGMQLKRKLNEIITENHGALSYDQVYSALEDTDEDPNDPSKLVLFYKGVSVADNELRTSDDGDIWNREHIWAKSHGDFGTSRGPGTDLHMIRPTDASVNARRGHLDFDESDNVFDEAPGTYVDKDSFEPRDEVKGDVARMLFYMAVRYEGNDGEVDLELSNRTDTFDLTDTGYGEHGKLDTLLEWHILDPVDDIEIKRNEVIYKIQGNRNPFIDHPEFVAFIWGESYLVDHQSIEQEDEAENVDMDTTSIESARKMSDGHEVTITGTIIYQENETTMYIQDEFAGIRVDSYGSKLYLDDFKVGNKVLVSGQLDTYKGEKEIRIDHQANLTLLNSVSIYEPRLVSLIELSDGEYQGQLIVVDDVEIIEISNNIIKIQDKDGYRMNIFYGNADNFKPNNIKVGGNYKVTALASWYNDPQIKLMDGRDIIELN